MAPGDPPPPAPNNAELERAVRDSPVKSDERVVLFPSLASRDGDDWVIPVHGWIFEPEEDSSRRRALVAGIEEALDLDDDPAAEAIFKRRIRPFLADSERGKALSLAVGDRIVALPESEAGGHFEANVRLSDVVAQRFARARRVQLQIVGPEGVPAARSHAVLFPNDATLVISDIDDTIKISNVLDKSELMRSTFTKPTKPVPQMGKALAALGAHVHFVSSSPWQLFEPLQGLARDEGLPYATFSLRKIRVKDRSILQLMADPLSSKVERIEAVMAALPKAHVVLVGDSGERDPEVYGEIARAHPDRVDGIYIRRVGDTMTEGRGAQAFADVPRARWHVVADGTDIPKP